MIVKVQISHDAQHCLIYNQDKTIFMQFSLESVIEDEWLQKQAKPPYPNKAYYHAIVEGHNVTIGAMAKPQSW